jgi:hypothetical protein
MTSSSIYDSMDGEDVAHLQGKIVDVIIYVRMCLSQSLTLSIASIPHLNVRTPTFWRNNKCKATSCNLTDRIDRARSHYIYAQCMFCSHLIYNARQLIEWYTKYIEALMTVLEVFALAFFSYVSTGVNEKRYFH